MRQIAIIIITVAYVLFIWLAGLIIASKALIPLT